MHLAYSLNVNGMTFCISLSRVTTSTVTRNLCCRKDYNAMRAICGCPQTFRDSLTTPTTLCPTFSWAFVPIKPMNVATKFEVHSFTRSWDNRGYPKIWAVPVYTHAPFSQKFLMGFYYRAMHFSACTVLGSHVVCLSVCPSVCNVGGLWSHRLEILETNCTDN